MGARLRRYLWVDRLAKHMRFPPGYVENDLGLAAEVLESGLDYYLEPKTFLTATND